MTPTLTALRHRQYRARVDAGEPVAHRNVGDARRIIRVLHDKRGMSYRRIAEEIEYTREQLELVMHKNRSTCPKQVHPRMLKNLSALEQRTRDANARADMFVKGFRSIDKSRRIIQGLMLQGYSHHTIGQMMNPPQSPSAVSHWLTQYDLISAHNDDELTRICAEVGMRYGGSTRTTARAQRLGYKPIAEWDDLI